MPSPVRPNASKPPDCWHYAKRKLSSSMIAFTDATDSVCGILFPEYSILHFSNFS
jgi:hypothetical protein